MKREKKTQEEDLIHSSEGRGGRRRCLGGQELQLGLERLGRDERDQKRTPPMRRGHDQGRKILKKAGER